MKQLKIIIFSILFIAIMPITAQQTPTYSDYMYNALLINPAHAGLYTETEIVMTNQGMGNSIEGSPRTFTGTFNSSINRGKMGFGGGILNDEIGVTQATQVFASYAYKIRLGHDYDQPRWFQANPQVISFGITAGFLSYRENLLELGLQDDPNFDENINVNIPTIGVGFLYNRRDVYFGISAPNVLGNTLASDKSINLQSPYYAYFGYRFYGNILEDYMIKPNALLKYEEGVPMQLDINLLVSYRNKVEIGAGYRTTSMFNFLAGFYLLNNFRIIYSYNYRISNSPLTNTHGLSLSYRFGKGYNNS
ncbi:MULTISPECIES: PorP/SprF family type IX secretion system membrane protein [Galbibacter]|uniref:PorP/SprF family type IX secretion system membrane protein n=1 Tax=Galbibacter pacificus TaxID=2996052 RepID=A0ABT6FNL6_9FLAO|nr:PorP/SprF family type IX secretion system membrane protein [Galbibacter pacificus]MDG3581370.1 PorP/SprF family type IX secretion system membrane protein [Galbibacter pacificus]MDG3584848.1 PorP/SprF family type IX secretion system membrane protein [Galbibacter pacificus]